MVAGGFGRGEHVALAIKNGARFDNQAGRVNFPGNDRLRLDLDLAARGSSPQSGRRLPRDCR